MADPISSAAAANIYKTVQQGTSQAGLGGGDQTGAGGVNFGSLIRSAAQDSINTMHASEKASADAVTGKADLTDVVDAVTNAELTLKTVVAVRDKMLDAYKEIMSMPI